MRTIVKGKNLDVPDTDRSYAQHKLQRLERVLDDRSDALVELSLERHKSLEDSHICEVTLNVDGRTLRGVARAASFHAAIDTVVDKLERRAVDHKEKPQRRSRPDEEKALLRTIADGIAEADGDRPAIVKVKRFAIEPMFEEDAVARMEELGHSFFVFVNAENEHLAVLYRRRDGDYGLIEPSVGGGYSVVDDHRPRTRAEGRPGQARSA
ncbi:MAG TPA: ribosome-associated translation inhibitor RaiA [Candidatus Limnocylindrales bacterium]|nr:ribosome-associated translation inhibitor RaiA [Candidatus Limnocylindrales bacterium]